MKLVLLEDDRDAREALAALLAFDACEVLQAADAAGFESAVAALDVDAVIFDQGLAGAADGLSLVQDYQARRAAAGLLPARLICVSGSSQWVGGEPRMPICRLRKPADYAAILAALRSRSD
jgi:DNA-binding NtrC family response regulator